jgi:hypothetical protein
VTTTAVRPGHGTLRVSLDSKSIWLSNHLPFVVRDARDVVVARGTVGQAVPTELEEGYYTVATIRPAGEPYRKVVHVLPDQTLELVVKDAHQPPKAPPDASLDGGQQLVQESVLVGMELCTATEVDTGWVFYPAGDLTGIPTATFQLGAGDAWVVSLPLNPRGDDVDRRVCWVSIEDAGTSSARPVTSFPRGRRVSRMIDGILRNHQVLSTEVLAEASELLMYKYADPSAAALGGLTLHRYGRLQERQPWVENLARDFSWIADGQVLLAALLMRAEGADQARGLDLLLAGTAYRPLYTDGLSLASELLRRWPGDQRRAERLERLDHLATYAGTADWGSVVLTTRRRG